jgi:hypothetical protein
LPSCGTVEILSDPGRAGKEYPIGDPDVFTFREIGNILSRFASALHVALDVRPGSHELLFRAFFIAHRDRDE